MPFGASLCSIIGFILGVQEKNTLKYRPMKRMILDLPISMKSEKVYFLICVLISVAIIGCKSTKITAKVENTPNYIQKLVDNSKLTGEFNYEEIKEFVLSKNVNSLLYYYSSDTLAIKLAKDFGKKADILCQENWVNAFEQYKSLNQCSLVNIHRFSGDSIKINADKRIVILEYRNSFSADNELFYMKLFGSLKPGSVVYYFVKSELLSNTDGDTHIDIRNVKEKLMQDLVPFQLDLQNEMEANPTFYIYKFTKE